MKINKRNSWPVSNSYWGTKKFGTQIYIYTGSINKTMQHSFTENVFPISE